MISLLILLTASFLAGCHSIDSGSAELRYVPPAGGAPVDLGGLLPSPRALLAGSGQEKSVSFSEEHYIKHGDEFAGSLPNRNVAISPGDGVNFTPSWSETGGMDPSRLAFCIYEFQISGFDRNPELRCGWWTEPPDIHSEWFGLSVWETDSWHWVRGQADNVIGFGSTEPYFDENDIFYVVVLSASDELSNLRRLRVGEIPATSALLEVTPRYARPPVTVKADAAGCAVPVGDVVSYEWDWDDDGDFEGNTGTDPICHHSFDAVGDYEYAVRLTSSYGETVTASDAVHIVEPWTHSWGDSLYQDITGIVTDGSEFCYSAGSTMRSAGHRDALLLKHNLGGGLEWAMAWGGNAAELLTDIEMGFGSVFTVGVTQSYGAGDEDVLILRWNDDGSIYWAAVWGTAGLDRGEGIALTDTAVYVIGSTMAMGNRDVLLLKYDLIGNFVWARTWGNSAYDVGTAIDSSHQPLTDEYNLYATGATFSPSPLYQDVLYLRFDEEAGFPTERVWHSLSNTDQYASAITVDGLMTKDIFIAGSIGESGDRKAMLLEVVAGPSCSAAAWVNSDECVADEILRLGDYLYIAGRGWNLGISSMGFVTEYSISSPGSRYAHWADDYPNTGLTALCSFPGSGLLVGGNCEAADLGSWSTFAESEAGYGGTWSNFSATINVPVESTESPTAASEELSGGVIDVGGGDWDALLSVVQYP